MFRHSSKPLRSPWGTIQHIETIAEGVAFVSTAGHGGIKLDRKRNAAMPAPLRIAGGWYEEDCEWALVVLGLPQHFTDKQRQDALQTVKDVFPTRYEDWTGETLPITESYEKCRRKFFEDNAEKLVAVSAFGSWHEKVPQGWVGIAAVKGGVWVAGVQTLWFLVPEAEYNLRNRFGYVVDPDKVTPCLPLQ